MSKKRSTAPTQKDKNSGSLGQGGGSDGFIHKARALSLRHANQLSLQKECRVDGGSETKYDVGATQSRPPPAELPDLQTFGLGTEEVNAGF